MKAPYISPIQIKDFPANGSIKEQIRFCCQYGALAPSVHNLQPWSIAIKGSQLIVSVYKDHRAEDSDATGRQTWISIGCFVENILQAAASTGMKAKISDEDYQKELITIDFSKASKKKLDQNVLNSMESRVSNRNPFEPVALTNAQRTALSDAAKGLDGAKLFIGSDKKSVELTATLTRQALALALSMPRFKKELAQTFRSNLSTRKTGIPGHALGKGLLGSFIEPLRYKYSAIAAQDSAKEYKRIKASAGIMFITSNGDIAKYWFNAGRLYERVALLLTQYGISQATIAATVEAPDFHQEIEKHLGTKNRLQAVMRYGKSNKKIAPSPRLSVDELLTSNASRD